MGFSISWAAVEGGRSQEALATLGLSATSEPDVYFETPFAGGLLPTGWFVIVSKDIGYFTESRLAELSASGRVVSALVEEHVMASVASEWRGGAEVWAAEHDGNRKDVRHLEVRGEAPANLAVIREETFRTQAEADTHGEGVDYCFDIPLAVAKSIVGFKHDESPEEESPADETSADDSSEECREWPFMRLEPATSAQPGATNATRSPFEWLSRLMGRRK